MGAKPRTKARAKPHATIRTKARPRCKASLCAISLRSDSAKPVKKAKTKSYLLGCARCRGGPLGCDRCRRPDFSGKRLRMHRGRIVAQKACTSRRKAGPSPVRISQRIRQGLLIRKPWINMILKGQKRWELRNAPTYKRGPIALIQSGTGTIVGTAMLKDCLYLGEHRAGRWIYKKGRGLLPNFSKHRATMRDVKGIGYSRLYAWVLSDAKKLATPKPYTHPPGAIQWVAITMNRPRQQ